MNMFTAGVTLAATEPARRAYEFTDSVGVCTHWGYPDTPYGSRFGELKDLLVQSGIRHVRDGLHARLHDLAHVGIHTTVVMEPKGADVTMAQLVEELRAFNTDGVMPPVEAVEGPNEPELFWSRYHPDGYKGQGFPEGPIAFLKDLHAAIKADPDLRHITVLGIALGTTLTPAHPDNPLGNHGELADHVDWGNFHPYPSGNAFNYPMPYDTIQRYYWDSTFPSLPIEGWKDVVTPWSIYHQAPYAPRPMAATETGYSTLANGIPESVVGKYIPRLFLEFFRKGIQRTFVYELVDEWDDPANREANFGLLRHDLSPKPSFTALRNLLRLLQDGPTSFEPGTVEMDLVVQPVTVKASTVRANGGDVDVVYDRVEYVRHMVLAKSTGERFIILWHDISNADHSSQPPVELTPPDMPAVLTVRGSYQGVRIHRFTEAGEVETSTSPSLTLNLLVPDRPLVVELVPPTQADAGASNVDAHVAGGDASQVMPDAGHSVQDAAVSVADAASPKPDAAVNDGAINTADASSADGSTQSDSGEDADCHCDHARGATTVQGLGWIAAVVWLGLRWRGRVQ